MFFIFIYQLKIYLKILLFLLSAIDTLFNILYNSIKNTFLLFIFSFLHKGEKANE